MAVFYGYPTNVGLRLEIWKLSTKIIKYSNSGIKFIELVNHFTDLVSLNYSEGKMPGKSLYNLSDSNMSFFRKREFTSDFKEKNISIGSNVSVFIDSLPFSSTDIIDLSVKVYEAVNGYSDLIDITFFKVGSFDNKVLNWTSSEVVKLNTPTVFFEIPKKKNSTGYLSCDIYDGSKWIPGNCSLQLELNNTARLMISHTSLFRLSDLYDNEETQDKDIKKYIKIIFCFFLFFYLIGLIIRYRRICKRGSQIDHISGVQHQNCRHPANTNPNVSLSSPAENDSMNVPNVPSLASGGNSDAQHIVMQSGQHTQTISRFFISKPMEVKFVNFLILFSSLFWFQFCLQLYLYIGKDIVQLQLNQFILSSIISCVIISSIYLAFVIISHFYYDRVNELHKKYFDLILTLCFITPFILLSFYDPIFPYTHIQIYFLVLSCFITTLIIIFAHYLIRKLIKNCKRSTSA